MQNFDRHNMMRALAIHYKPEMESKKTNHSNKMNVYALADKHGLGDVLGRDLPEPKDMQEMNEQIQTIEEVIKAMRAHIQTQYRRLMRNNMKGILL